jgi:putative ABC transport system permease protein
MGNTLGQVHGILVVRQNVPGPIFSDLPAELAETLRKIPGVRVVAPEVWKVAPSIEGRSILARSAISFMTKQREQRPQGIFDTLVVEGQDLSEHLKLKRGAFQGALLPPGRGGGRFLNLADVGQKRIVISTKTATDYPVADGRPRRVGDTLRIGDELFTIVGLFDTGSLVLDRVIAMDITTARRLLGVREGAVSCFLVEPVTPSQTELVMAAIEQTIPEVDARSTSDIQVNVSRIIDDLDMFLLMVISLAMVVGCVGIVNTMLMSTSERFVEFGVLRTNGWKRKNVLKLVLAESSYLGLLSGLLGCVLASIGVQVANLFLSGGLKLQITPIHMALGIVLALVMGAAGGLYPAWRASQLMPMEAIRRGGY